MHVNTSRNERVTQQAYDTYLQMFNVCTLRHTAHIEAIVQFHTKRFLLRSRHYCFVPSQTEREEGSGIAHAHKTWTPAVSFHMGKLTSVCVLKVVMADWNRYSHFDTPCIYIYMFRLSYTKPFSLQWQICTEEIFLMVIKSFSTGTELSELQLSVVQDNCLTYQLCRFQGDVVGLSKVLLAGRLGFETP